MFAKQNSTKRRIIALSLAAFMVCPPVAGLLTAAGAAPEPAPPLSSGTAPLNIKSILLFPSANNAGTAADPLVSRLDDAIKIRINSVGKLKATSYSRLLPSVQRALDDNVISADTIAPPFTDIQKDGRIAQQVETDAYYVGAIESYNADPTTRKVTLEVSGNLYSTATGASLRSLAFTGNGVASSNADTLDTSTQVAINDVASKIAGALNASAPAPAMEVKSAVANESRSHSGLTLLYVLLGGALLYAIFHKGSSSSTTTTTTGGTGGGGGGTTTGSGGDTPPGIPPI